MAAPTANPPRTAATDPTMVLRPKSTLLAALAGAEVDDPLGPAVPMAEVGPTTPPAPLPIEVVWVASAA